MLLMTGMSGAASAYEWAVDPQIPGADLPMAGTSLFDRITTDSEGRQRIPYPYEALVAHMEATAGCATSPCTRSVLIPLGRSLQRMAAAPDFFAHPRVVTAAVADGDGELLRDRLYLGFQRQAGVIEVISYNETLGRFEFQIVRNYVKDGAPQAVYARRTMCISCHQNHGPIFSQQVWLETNANPAIAAKLRLSASQFSGVDARGNTDIAQSIDDATDRANRMALTKRLWRDACGQGDQGDRCRRAAVAASLQLALSGGRSYANAAAGFGSDVTQTLARNARAQWPAGIAVANPDIPNRNPLEVPAGVTGRALAAVDVRFDPLVPRAPLDVLSPADGGRLADELVHGLAAFWSQRDLASLTNALRRHAAPRRRLRSPCRISGSQGREQFDCGETDGLRLMGTLDGADGTIDQIGTNETSLVRHLPVRVHRGKGTLTLRMRDSRVERLADGNAIEQIVLRAQDPAGAQVDVRQDFDALLPFIEGVDLDQDVVRSDVLPALIATLSGTARPQSERRVAAVADTYSAVPANTDTLTLALETQCGSCHHAQEPVPPNFLFGDAARVTAAIESCAPRIYVRLAMRGLPVSQRDRSPMPPDTLAGDHAMSDADNRALVELRAAVEAHLQKRQGARPSVDQLLEQGYEALPPCLPTAVTETLQ